MSQLTAVTAQLAESLASLNAEVGRLREHVEAHEGNQGVLDKRLVAAEDALSAVEDGLAHVNTGFSEKLHQQRRCRIR
jgi:predicted  nucleic acid-binding Zn-ribbon protein